MLKIQTKQEAWVVQPFAGVFLAVPLGLAGFNDDSCVNLQQAFPDGDYSEFHKRGDLIKTQTGFFWFMSLYMQKATFARPVAKILKKSLIFLETSFE